MDTFKIENLSFTYPQRDKPALDGIDLSIRFGEFITLCGKSGSGKSTLLRNLKSTLAPHGRLTGSIKFYDRELSEVSQKEQASRIGYVLQNPENQLVTDKVWHELAFGLESLGYDTRTIRLRVAEMASFFGIQNLFLRNISELSGGQKQVVNLASIMAMLPDVLILDEPTSQLDPIAAGEFLETVRKINRDIGTTILITEHRLDEVLPMSDRALVMEKGRILLDGPPSWVGKELGRTGNDLFKAMPAPMQIYAGLMEQASDPEGQPTGLTEGIPSLTGNCPITVRDGRNWMTELFAGREISAYRIDAAALEWKDGEADKGAPKRDSEAGRNSEPAIQLKDVWFRYEKETPDVVKDLSMTVQKGDLYCIVGGNGTGKTTALTLISGINRPHRGRIRLKDRELKSYKSQELFDGGLLGVLPQNPQSLFVEKTVGLDLLEMLERKPLSQEAKQDKVRRVAELVEITDLMDSHPYDLSGGEQQRAALGKVLLLEPEILLLDEPTKGLDNVFKEKLADIFAKLKDQGVTIVMVSHDIEFCGKYADVCAMFFDGNIVTTNVPNEFFSGNNFYTTASNRMSRHIFENAVTTKDVIYLCKTNLKGAAI